MNMLPIFLQVALNASSQAASVANTASMATFGNIGLVISIVLACGLTACLLVLLSNWEYFKKAKGFFGWLTRTFGFFLYGVLTIILFGVPALILYWFGSATAANPQVLFWIGVVVLAYFAICLLGWLLKPVYAKIGKNMHSPRKNPKPR